MIGKIINNYIIEKKLGEGGMGNVYMARHNRVDRIVAVKILHQNLFENENIRNRFKNEANALIKLGHPNIVKIYDYVEQDDFACLIMEYIDGYTLDDYITKVSGPLVSTKALNIICKVLDAVQYAHENNIYHRDIKPGNIMLSTDGSAVRVMDFGIAKIIDAANFKVTHANAQLGTPFYMSPEQVKGLPYTVLSDIYSLGVTLFEMITGKCPYQAITNLFELQSKIVNEPLPPTGFYYPHVPQYLQDAIIRATKKEPRERFSSCAAFKSFLLKQSTVVPEMPVAEPKKIIKKPDPVKDIRKSSQEINIPGKIKERKPASAGSLNYTIPTISSTGSAAPPLPMPEPELGARKTKRWIMPVSVAAVLLISGFIYIANKKDSTADITITKDTTSTELAGSPNIIDTAKTGNGGADTAHMITTVTPATPAVRDTIKDPIKVKTIPPPIDRDHDGIPDTQDKCPDEPGTWKNQGCPPQESHKFNLTPQKLKEDVATALSCNGEFYSGSHQQLNIQFPSNERMAQIEEGGMLNIIVIFKTCKYTAIYKKINGEFKYEIVAQ